MAISLRDLMDGNTQSVQQQASANNLPYEPFTLRELITPQYEVDVPQPKKKTWHNWVGQHDDKRVAHLPENKKQLITTVVRAARSQSSIRAVGSGHSHSNAPAPPDDYVELNPGEPGGEPPYARGAGLNSVLGHEGWLKSDGELLEIQEPREGSDSEGESEDRPDPLDRDHLKRVQSGIILRRLNRHILHKNGYALQNIGSFDGQTIAGAVNTSTHGTGVGLASISDSVKSVEIVAVPKSESGEPIVRLYRIEPSDGITDREEFEADTGKHEMELIQDDDVFHSVVVGYGCMGVAYAYTLHVRDSYWLREETELMNWKQLTNRLSDESGDITTESVKSFLTKSDDDGKPCRHTQILVNIAADQVPKERMIYKDKHNEAKNNPICAVKRHYEVDEMRKPQDWPEEIRWPPERPKNQIRKIGKDLLRIHPLALKPNYPVARILHKNLFHDLAEKAPFGDLSRSAWYIALRRLRDGGTDVSDYFHPEPPRPPTLTTEVGVKLENIVDAVNAARDRIRKIKNDEFERPVFFPVPMGLRFTAASEHYLSPEEGRKTAMLEVPVPMYDLTEPGPSDLDFNAPKLSQEHNRERVIEPALTKLHNKLVFTGGKDSDLKFEARPHMGKHNTVGKGWLRANYDYFDANAPGFPADAEEGWLQVYNRFNAFGTFDNKFTEQLGISNS